MVNWKNLIVNPPRDWSYYLFKVESKEEVTENGNQTSRGGKTLKNSLPKGTNIPNGQRGYVPYSYGKS